MESIVRKRELRREEDRERRTKVISKIKREKREGEREREKDGDEGRKEKGENNVRERE